jgi:iron complex outermembrane receptor protein
VASDPLTIVISAARTEQGSVATPASITVITAEEIERSGSRNLADLLRGRAGIQVRDFFGDGSGGAVFDLRGFGPTATSNTLILVDGRRLNNGSDTAAPDVTTISLKNIERIEIVQGSAGTLFGNQAVGGVINIITRRPQEFEAQADVTIGSYDSIGATASLSNSHANGFSYRLALEKRESDNYRDHNRVEYENAAARMDYQYGSGILFGEYHYTDEELQFPGALFADELSEDRRQSVADYANDFSDTRTHFGRIGIDQTLSDQWSLEAEFAYREVDRTFAASFRGFAVPPGPQEREVYTFTPRFIGVFPLSQGEAQVTVGADLERTDYYLSSIVGTQEVEQDIRGYYAQGVVPLHRKVDLTLGLRRAEVENYIRDAGAFPAFPNGEHLDDALTVGTAGLAWRPRQGWRLFARADENYRFAKVEEHTDAGGSPTGVKNQTGISYELGGEWRGSNGSFKLIAYRLDLEDEISYDTALFRNVNLDSTRREGAMLELAAKLNRRTEVGFNYQYVDARVESGSFVGNRVPLVAEHSATLLLDYRPLPLLELHGEVKYVGDQVLGGDFANAFPKLPDYTVANLGGEYRFGNWSLRARVNNLFDHHYSDTGATGYTPIVLQDAYFPAPERNWWLTLGYEYH